MRTTVFLLVVLAGVCFAATLFEDDFDDGSADGWTEYTTHPGSASYYVEEGWYHMEITPANGLVFAFSGDEGASSWHMSVPDYTVLCRTRAFSNTQHVGIAARWQEPYSNHNAYVLWLRYWPNLVSIYRHDGGANYEILASAPFTLGYDLDYCIRLDVYGDLIQGKVWQGDLSDEPEEFLVSVNDATYMEPGSIGMGCEGSGAELKHAAIDWVIVTDSAYDLALFTWGGVKGSF